MSDYSVNEGSTALINLWFKDENERNVIPSIVNWYLNDATYYYASGSEVPTSYKHDLVIPSELNLLYDRNNLWEEKILTIIYNYGGSYRGTDEFRYQVKRLEKINSTDLFAILGNGSVAPVNVTYTQLLNLSTGVNGNWLTPGQKYRITDFRTYHLIPNTLEYNSGTVEPLIVTALSTSELSNIVHSETYPQDIIHYELVQTHSWEGNPIDGGDRGWIYYREDTLRRNKLAHDFRACKWRRWNSQADGLGTWTVLTDNTFPYEDFYTFNTYEDTGDNDLADSFNDYTADSRPGYNTVFMGHAASNRSRSGLENNTFVGQTHVNDFGIHCSNNVVIGVCSFNRMVDNYNGNYAYSDLTNNSFGIDNTSMVYEDTFYGNIVGQNNSVTSVTFEAAFWGNVIDITDLGGPVVYPTAQTNKTYRDGISTMVESMDWDYGMDLSNVTTDGISYRNIKYAGIVNLLGAGGTYETSVIFNFPDHPVTFVAEAGYTFTFTHTLYDDITADGQIMEQADIVIVGDYADEVTLKKVTITNLNGTFNVLRKVY